MTRLPQQAIGGPIQENFDALVKDRDALAARVTALEALGLTKRTRGVANVSTTAAAFGSATITHGLGTTPNQVQITSQNSGGVGLAACAAGNVGATTFDANIRYGDGVARTATVVVAWEAIA